MIWIALSPSVHPLLQCRALHRSALSASVSASASLTLRLQLRFQLQLQFQAQLQRQMISFTYASASLLRRLGIVYVARQLRSAAAPFTGHALYRPAVAAMATNVSGIIEQVRQASAMLEQRFDMTIASALSTNLAAQVAQMAVLSLSDAGTVAAEIAKSRFSAEQQAALSRTVLEHAMRLANQPANAAGGNTQGWPAGPASVLSFHTKADHDALTVDGKPPSLQTAATVGAGRFCALNLDNPGEARIIVLQHDCQCSGVVLLVWFSVYYTCMHCVLRNAFYVRPLSARKPLSWALTCGRIGYPGLWNLKVWWSN